MSARVTMFDDAIDVRSIALRLAPIDVGFDLRAENTLIEILPDCTRASYADLHGVRWVVDGTAREIVRELKKHGYRVEVAP